MEICHLAAKCNSCYKKFRIYRQRHYCTACYKPYCLKCCNEWILLPGISIKQIKKKNIIDFV